MKITFLGTSHGFAEKDRFTSSAVIESGGHYYVVDAGAPVEALMMKKDMRLEDIRGIFITHMHNDHVSSLSEVILPFLRWHYNDKVTCFLPEEGALDAFSVWVKAMHDDLDKMKEIVDFRVTKKGTIFENEDIKVTAVPTRHLEYVGAPSFGYIFEQDGKKVLFTGDMHMNFEDYDEVVGKEHYDLVVCELAHADLREVADKLAKTNTDKMIINHIYPVRMEGWEEILPIFDFDTQLAQDSLVVLV